MPEYETVFGDERADDSTNDRSVLELSNREKALLLQALAEHVRVAFSVTHHSST
jgi:hypothetical protein